MTRLIGRLKDRGLVRRDPDPDDARAFLATLTSDGKQKLAKARITHDTVITRMIAPHLNAADLRALQQTLDKIINSTDP